MRLGRRRFSLFALLAPLLGRSAASASAAIPQEDVVSTLAQVAKAVFPHEGVAAEHYAGVAAAFLNSNATQGERLAAAVGAVDFLAATPSQRTAVLRALENTPDFQVFRFHVLVMTYNDLSVTRRFGYEGPSYEEGGYLTRGFDDIDWLPAADPDAR